MVALSSMRFLLLPWRSHEGFYQDGLKGPEGEEFRVYTDLSAEYNAQLKTLPEAWWPTAVFWAVLCYPEP